MALIAVQAKQMVFELAAQRGFVDPMTGRPPSCERELSAILAVYHQFGLVRWEAVPLRSASDPSSVVAASQMLLPSDLVVTEYPLIAANQRQVNIWGGMPADLIFYARDGARIILIENKIGSGCTYGPSPRNSQFARQIDYLAASKPPVKCHVLLTIRYYDEHGWYHSELAEALRFTERRGCVTGYIMQWEDVFSAVTAP